MSSVQQCSEFAE